MLDIKTIATICNRLREVKDEPTKTLYINFLKSSIGIMQKYKYNQDLQEEIYQFIIRYE